MFFKIGSIALKIGNQEFCVINGVDVEPEYLVSERFIYFEPQKINGRCAFIFICD